MKLLIVTQKVDRNDPILGFFHAWLELFARRCESVTVIAQSIGEHSLPPNVHVVGLGKEGGTPRMMQIARFWLFIVRHRSSYDAVLVHMTPVWILLGAPVWVALRKRMYLWYEIRRGSVKLSLALLLVRKVFAASAAGIPGTSRKLVVTGHGIDTALFRPDPAKRDSHATLSVGRITQVKRYDVILDAFAKLPSDLHLAIAGGVITGRDEEEMEKLREQMESLGIIRRIVIGWVSPADLPALLQHATLFLHAAEGGLDKALLEAMASGCLVVSTSKSACDLLPEACSATSETIAAKAGKLLALGTSERQRLTQELRGLVERGHSLPQCIARLVTEMQS